MIDTDEKLSPAGLITMPLAPASIASCIQSTLCDSAFDCRNWIVQPGAASRHWLSISASVVG